MEVTEKSLNFLEEIVEKYVAEGGKELQTRFPPEPNGYLHIGHAKSICLNFGLAAKYGGKCNLRFDDTNPAKEDVEYVDSIKADIKWLGFDWAVERYASDYFEQLYDWAVELIRRGRAYVDDQTQEQIRLGRGTVLTPGVDSPFRGRSVEENLDLFARMRAGEFEDGARVLRVKIDMAHPNMLFRDPILYRILHTTHHRTGDKWCIYPMYDYAHGQSDSIERITHSICTLEFAVHRPLYDWFIEELGIFPSHQYEFARLNLTYTMMSKRKLLQLVESQIVTGWDDPRMPTISGMRRRGYTAAAIRAFAERVGVAKRDNVIDLGLLEYCVREDLNKTASRRMAVVNPLRVVITNWPGASAGSSSASASGSGGGEMFHVEQIRCVNNPEDESAGVREVPLTREIYIERDDFMEEPPKKFFRLSPGGEVRLRYGYLIRCDEVVKDEGGEIVELRCTYDPQSGGGGSSDGRRVKGVIHWVSAHYAVEAEARLYNPLFVRENPEDPAEGTTGVGASTGGSASATVPRGRNGACGSAEMSSREECSEVSSRSGENVPRGTTGVPTGTYLDNLNPESLVRTRVMMEPALAKAKVGETFQFERIGYFCVDPDSASGVDAAESAVVANAAPRKLVFNRTVTLKDSWAKQQ